MSIAHSIVSALGGCIFVDSVVGQGSRFRVELPGAPATASSPTLTMDPAPARRGRVLIVDDEPLVGRSLRRVLSRAHEVTVVGGAQEALELLKVDAGWDLVLCDLMMPGKSGMELFEEAVARDPRLQDRFAFMTGGAFTPRAREFLARVPNDRFHKPVDVAALLALIERQRG